MFSNWVRQLIVVLATSSQFAILGILSANFGEGNPFPALGTDVFFLPARYAFAIWGAILFLSATYATYQLRPDQGKRVVHKRIGWWVVLNTSGYSLSSWLAANQGTFGTDTYQPLYVLGTVIIICAMLVANIAIFLNIRRSSDTLVPQDRWLVIVPQAIYFGWLTVATVANNTYYLYRLGWRGEQYGELITIGLLAIVLVISGWITSTWHSTQGTVTYGAVIMWASIAIAVGNIGQSILVAGTALAVALLTLVVIVTNVNRGGLRRRNKASA